MSLRDFLASLPTPARSTPTPRPPTQPTPTPRPPTQPTPRSRSGSLLNRLVAGREACLCGRLRVLGYVIDVGHSADKKGRGFVLVDLPHGRWILYARLLTLTTKTFRLRHADRLRGQ